MKPAYKFSPAVRRAHEVAADMVAQSFLTALRRDTDATLGTLRRTVEVFPLEIAQSVRAAAARQGIHHLTVRLDLVEQLARDVIRAVLREDSSQLAAKLVKIRETQRDRDGAPSFLAV